MTDKQQKFVKFLVLVGIILCVSVVAVHILTYFGAQSVLNQISNNPQDFPNNFGVEVGFGLVLLIYMWIFHGIFLVLLIPNVVLKKRFYKNPTKKNKVLDVVFTCLVACGSVPSLIYGIMYCGVIFEILSYGVGVMLVPFVLFVVAQLGYVVASIVQLCVCEVPKMDNQPNLN